MAFRELTLDQTNEIESVIYELKMLMVVWGHCGFCGGSEDPEIDPFIAGQVHDKINELNDTWGDATGHRPAPVGGLS